MVVKPLEFFARNRRGLIQPAVKCRGREYLRIIYGPEYTAPENLERLRSRGLAAKRSLALREFALGIESLERFVQSNRCVEFMNASLECWRLKASQWILAFKCCDVNFCSSKLNCATRFQEPFSRAPGYPPPGMSSPVER